MNDLVVVDGFPQEQIDIIRSQVAPQGTTNEELRLFLMYCQRTNLDPFARQIYLSERRSQVNGQWIVTRKPETTIDGFRLIAERSDKYAGQVGPFWCGTDGKWVDVWLEDGPPAAARVGVLRHDFKEPIYSVALYKEYVQTTRDGLPNTMWKRMAVNQLAKCAESLSLRRAFPRELSGLYTREEMGQAEHHEERGSVEAAQEVAVNKIAALKATPLQRAEPPSGDPIQVYVDAYEQKESAKKTRKPAAALPDDPPELAAYIARLVDGLDAQNVKNELRAKLYKLGGQPLVDGVMADITASKMTPAEKVRIMWKAIQDNQPPEGV